MELPLSRLDLNLLTVFDMLMQERNVTRAAERLHLSQSTVSHALGRLRQALDDPLFVMSRREMMPTERAKALAGPVRQALAMLEQGLRQAKGFDPASAQRVFRIATPGSVEHGLVPTLVERMVQHVRHHCGAEPACFMTGGAGWKMAPSMSVQFELVDSLIFDGLLEIAARRWPG